MPHRIRAARAHAHAHALVTLSPPPPFLRAVCGARQRPGAHSPR
eukprot:CAMPEP_0180576050 /NCGR_PEP_ID=MMETSP1037_2-20121125/11216_1 /TAXON_ID=632150 /ORGANISM="Azadinium spinosum, Strain 3D9" /LENGTH=43 /DNA_ID= /DNA_START= /DNA_END= /DNA_ORIENTATION=